MFTSIDDAVEVDVDLVLESKGRGRLIVKKILKLKYFEIKIYSCLNLFLLSFLYFWSNIFLSLSNFYNNK